MLSRYRTYKYLCFLKLRNLCFNSSNKSSPGELLQEKWQKIQSCKKLLMQFATTKLKSDHIIYLLIMFGEDDEPDWIWRSTTSFNLIYIFHQKQISEKKRELKLQVLARNTEDNLKFADTHCLWTKPFSGNTENRVIGKSKIRWCPN